MTKYRKWSLVQGSRLKVELFIDGKPFRQFLEKDNGDTSRKGNLPTTSVVDKIEDVPDSVSLVKTTVEKMVVTLDCTKFDKSCEELFGERLNNAKTDILRFWEDHFPLVSSIGEDSAEDLDSTLHIVAPEESNNQEVNLAHNSDTSLENGEELEIDDTSRSNDKTSPGSGVESIISTNVKNKRVGNFLLSVFDILDPPDPYKVREVDDEFVDRLSESMIRKNCISLDNAPNVIGLVCIKKEDFSKTELEENKYKVFAIDGNHSLEAQRRAYQQTEDAVFLFRDVNIYCGLTPEESLYLGISRNEDASSVLKFTDFQKVDLLRRQLYSMTATPSDLEPPDVPPGYSERAKVLLGLKTKSQFDSKACLRMIATKFSNRCYRKLKEIYGKSPNIPASKFEALRGLSEKNMYELLEPLADSALKKDDWRDFKTKAAAFKNCRKQMSKDEVLEVVFQEFDAALRTNRKLVSDSCVCFSFKYQKHTKLLTQEQLREVVFGDLEQSKPEQEILSLKTSTPKGKFFKSRVLKKKKTVQCYRKSNAQRTIYSFSSEISPAKSTLSSEQSTTPTKFSADKTDVFAVDSIQNSPNTRRLGDFENEDLGMSISDSESDLEKQDTSASNQTVTAGAVNSNFNDAFVVDSGCLSPNKTDSKVISATKQRMEVNSLSANCEDTSTVDSSCLSPKKNRYKGTSATKQTVAVKLLNSNCKDASTVDSGCLSPKQNSSKGTSATKQTVAVKLLNSNCKDASTVDSGCLSPKQDSSKDLVYKRKIMEKCTVPLDDVMKKFKLDDKVRIYKDPAFLRKGLFILYDSTEEQVKDKEQPWLGEVESFNQRSVKVRWLDGQFGKGKVWSIDRRYAAESIRKSKILCIFSFDICCPMSVELEHYLKFLLKK